MLDGIILGIFTWLSILFTYSHLPNKIKKLLIYKTIVADLLATGISFVLLAGISQSIISVVGSITTGLLVNLTLFFYKNTEKE